jgi:hypothetical protein
MPTHMSGQIRIGRNGTIAYALIFPVTMRSPMAAAMPRRINSVLREQHRIKIRKI